MKLHTVAALALAVVAGGVGLSADVWAGGAGGGNESCWVNTGSSLGNPIQGTVAIHGVNTGSSFILESVLRLQSSGKEQVFRGRAAGVQVISPTGTACDVLQGVGGTAPLGANGTIQQAFVLGAQALKVNNRSLVGLDWTQVPNSASFMTIVEVTIYPTP